MTELEKLLDFILHEQWLIDCELMRLHNLSTSKKIPASVYVDIVIDRQRRLKRRFNYLCKQEEKLSKYSNLSNLTAIPIPRIRWNFKPND